MSARINVSVHCHNDKIEASAKSSGSTIWVDIDNGTTIFVNNIDQVETILRAFHDAGNLIIANS